MAVLAVLQSRLSSSRLPAKAMLTVAGTPMVVLAARRAGNRGASVVVATSDQPEDDLVQSVVRDAGITVVRGPLEDPLARFAIAARDCADDDVVVRLTADNVVPDGALVAALAEAVSAGAGYVRVGGDDRALPYGVAGEAFTVAALRRAHDRATAAHDREHVTPWIRSELGDRLLELPDVPPRWRGLRCTVDTFDDYVRVSRLLAQSPDPVGEPWRSLCDRLAAQVGPVAEEWPVDNPLGQAPLVLGTVQLGVPYGAANSTGLPSDAAAAAILHEARSQGLSHLDTARAYGLSESRIGAAADRGLSEHLRVVTKLRPLDDVPSDAAPAWARAAVEASFAASRQALGRAPVDGVLVHRAADWHKAGGAVRDALVSLRDEGGCRVVGASLSTPAELLTVLADPECGYVQLPFNVADRRWLADDVQRALAARPDVVVTCRSVYLQGLLLAGAQARWPAAAGVDVAAYVALLDELVDELGRSSRADLCLAYVLGHDWVTSVVVGAETPQQLAESATLARNPRLSPTEVARVLERLPTTSEVLVDPSRWSTS